MSKSIIIMAALSAAAACHAQWTVTNLHQAGAFGSGALATTGTQQAGAISFCGRGRAGIWSGTAASWVELHPAGALGSVARSTTGAQQVGFTVPFGGSIRAALWSGSAASWVDLHPAGASESEAYAISGAQQAGEVIFPGFVRLAAIWSGSAASWVNLNPIGATGSGAFATTGAQQAGWASFGGMERAAFWSGSAESWVDLHPAGAISSVARATTGAQQAGIARFGAFWHAGIWSGSAASWVNLHPAGATESQALSTTGAQQAGFANFGHGRRAGVWSGTSASWEPLATPRAVWASSVANSIWSDGTTTYVAGSGTDFFNRVMALLWSRPVNIRVSGRAMLEGYLAPTAGEMLEVQIFQNGVLVQTIVSSCGANGSYGISPAVSGPMTLKFRFHTGLWKAVNVNLGASPITGLSVNIFNGDQNRDNAVDLTDIDAVIGCYGTTPGHPDYSAFADLDGDFDVDLTDIDIAIANYLREGD